MVRVRERAAGRLGARHARPRNALPDAGGGGNRPARGAPAGLRSSNSPLRRRIGAHVVTAELRLRARAAAQATATDAAAYQPAAHAAVGIALPDAGRSAGLDQRHQPAVGRAAWRAESDVVADGAAADAGARGADGRAVGSGAAQAGYSRSGVCIRRPPRSASPPPTTIRASR
ncbi:hypothetical protein M8494_33060 [Serratia ureilytica]